MEKNQKIKGILFDLDGTLVDTAPDFILSLNNILLKHKYPRLDDQLIRSHVSDGSKKLTTLGFGINEDDPDFNMLRIEFLAEYKKNLLKNSFLFDGVSHLIKFLNNQKVQFGIVTNKPREYAEPLIDNFDALKRSRVLVCSDDIKESKPSPIGIEKALKELNIKNTECLYVGDHPVDMLAGKNAGLEVIACYYGYSLSINNNQYTSNIINKPEELIDFVKNQR